MIFSGGSGGGVGATNEKFAQNLILSHLSTESTYLFFLLRHNNNVSLLMAGYLPTKTSNFAQILGILKNTFKPNLVQKS